jgi:4-amino-4-deoxy-L-arabinose transferase-like glycosyltransferase
MSLQRRVRPTGRPDTVPASDPGRASRWGSRLWGARARIVPVALALGCLGVVGTRLSMPYPSDQLNYMSAAARFPSPMTGSTEMQQVTRFGLLIPVRLAIMVFGYSQAAYYVVPLLGTLALMLGTYAVGTLLFSRTVGVAAAITVIAATPVFLDSSQLLPDIPATGLFTLALAMALAVRQGRLPARGWVLAALGLVLGWSYLVREFIVFLWPLIPVLIYRRVRWTGLVWLVAPIVALGLAETLLCWALYDDPLARVKAITGQGQGYSPPEIAGTFRDLPRHEYLLRLPTTLNDYRDGAWLIVLLGLTLLGGVVRPRRLAVPVAWCALLWVPLTLLGGILDPSKPRLRLQLIRYWFPIFPAFVIGGLGAIWLAASALSAAAGTPAANDRARRAITLLLPATAVLLTAVLTGTTAASGWRANPMTRVTQLESLRSWLARHDTDATVVWADQRTDDLLRVYQHGPFGGLAWHGTIRTAVPGGAVPAPGDLVLFFDAQRGRICGICRKYARLNWGNPPLPRPGWQQVYATRDNVVRLYAAGPAAQG